MNQSMKRARRGKEAIAEKKNYLFISLLNMDKFREISELNLFLAIDTLKDMPKCQQKLLRE